MIRYPAPLSEGSIVAITAPSSGVSEAFHPRLDIALKYLRSQGYKVIEGECLRSDFKHVSASKEKRAAELMRFFHDPDVRLIFPPWGGEIAHDLLPLLDFEAMKSSPTWIQGFSDTSTYLLPLTLLTDIATAHGTNLMDSVPSQSDELTRNSLGILRLEKGQSYRQHASQFWQKTWNDIKANPTAPYALSEKTEWKILGSQRSADFKGRLIGGCLDTIAFLIGTRFGDIPGFIRKYRDDGVILYLENCDQDPTSVHRHLSNMKLAGWMDGISGLLIGRSSGPRAKSADKLDYEEALADILGDLTVPIVYDTDIGHVVPQMTLVNGALAKVFCEGGTGWGEQKFL